MFHMESLNFDFISYLFIIYAPDPAAAAAAVFFCLDNYFARIFARACFGTKFAYAYATTHMRYTYVICICLEGKTIYWTTIRPSLWFNCCCRRWFGRNLTLETFFIYRQYIFLRHICFLKKPWCRKQPDDRNLFLYLPWKCISLNQLNRSLYLFDKRRQCIQVRGSSCWMKIAQWN